MGAGLGETWVEGGLVGRGDLETGQQKDLKTAEGEMIFRSKPWRREEGIVSWETNGVCLALGYEERTEKAQR